MNKFLSLFFVLCLSASAAEKIADKSTYLAGLCEQLKIQWPKNRTINIVCHGHSVPSGYFKTPVVDTFNAYPHLLHKALKEKYPFAVINVIVTGIGGENSKSGVKRFEKDVLSHNPDLITVDYALNDRGMSLEETKKYWVSMIEMAKKKNVKLLLLTPTGDHRAKMSDPEDALSKHAEQIRKLAAEHGVGLVDSYEAFNDYIKAGGELKDIMSQVNHPNRKGHDLVVEKLMNWFPQ